MREVDQLDAAHLRVIVDDASTALPGRGRGHRPTAAARCAAASETRPSFDTVFATLVERQRAEDAAAAEAAEAATSTGEAA